MRGESLSSWLRLALIPGIGGETQRKLLAAFGLPEAVFGAEHSALRTIISDRVSRLLLDTRNEAAIETAIRWANLEGQSIITLADPEYPPALLEIPDPPIVLYVRGRLDLLSVGASTYFGDRFFPS